MPATRIWPLLTATIRYEKTVSLRNIGHGEMITAPVMAYLIETPNGRLLYDVGCDYSKVSDPVLKAQYFAPMAPGNCAKWSGNNARRTWTS